MTKRGRELTLADLIRIVQEKVLDEKQRLLGTKILRYTLTAFLEEIEKAVADGQEVSLMNFGRFYTSHLPEKKIIDPVLKEEWIMESHNIPTFTPGRRFKHRTRYNSEYDQVDS